MVVVLDTSVFVSALRGRGASRETLRACLDSRLRPLMGASLMLEYESLMARGSVWEGSLLDAEERDLMLDSFLAVCSWTRVYYLWRPNLRDESDNHLVELAVAGGAEAIVTRNRRDLESGDLSFPGIRVVSPEELSEELERWQR